MDEPVYVASRMADAASRMARIRLRAGENTRRTAAWGAPVARPRGVWFRVT